MSMVDQEEQSVSSAVSDEQAADLRRLEGMAAQQDEAALADEKEQAQSVGTVESLAGLLQVVGVAAGALGYRRVQALWNEEACKGLAARSVPVLKKYPWGNGIIAFLDGDSGVEELALGMCLLPLTLGTLKAVKNDAAEKAHALEGSARKGEKPEETGIEPEKAGLSA